MNHHDTALWCEVIASAILEAFSASIDHSNGIAFMYVRSKGVCDISRLQQFEIAERRVTPKCDVLMHARCVHMPIHTIGPTQVAPYQLPSRLPSLFQVTNVE